MRVGRRAATQEPQRGGGRDLVPGARRDENRIAGADRAGFRIDFHNASPLEHKIEFLAQLVVMAVGGPPGGKGGFREALVGDRGIGAVEDAPDGGTIFGGEWFLAG